ncbi:MAG: VanW family protein [Clostridia bacterium]|nr:VanW family protein [Clostridia bacterium]MBR1686608.1 VanW family protein [Clostridia bacterium]
MKATKHGMKRFVFGLLAVMMLVNLLPVYAEEGEDEEDVGSVSAQTLAEIEELDAINDDEIVYVVGETYHEPDASEFDAKSPALYTCKTLEGKMGILYSDRSIESAKVVSSNDRLNLELLSVGLVWCVARTGGAIGYIKRDKLTAFAPVDPVNTPPYGTMKPAFIARTNGNAHVRKSMSDQDDNWVVLNPDSRVSIWRVQDGWGIVIYMRNYGYIRMDELKELIPVSPTDEPIREDSPIGAYTSFYKMTDNEANIGRIHNIANASNRLSRVMQPGEDINYNKSVGPFRASNGYEKAPVLVNGTTALGHGGGVCQVSSTIYNVLLQLPKITILQRRPHGPSGASYLPHGVDAASGGTNLNLRFRNDYDFPIRIEAQSMGDGALFMAIYKVQ